MWLWPGSLAENLAMLGTAVALDLAVGEPPPPLHPVRWMGKAIVFLERRAPVSGRVWPFVAGVVMAGGVPAASAAAAWWAAHGLHVVGTAAYVLAGGVLLKTTFALRGLAQAAVATARQLEAGQLAAARSGLRSLVSRDTASLEPEGVAAAAIESVAENSTDSYVAPWVAFALFGLPGAFAYRAINTLDSMIGYRGRYEYLGKASARLDDLVNLIPARASGALMLVAGALRGLPVARGWRTMRRDSRRTASPNAGWTMSAMAGLLGVRLEKVGHYILGQEFAQPGPGHIRRAIALTTVLAALGLALTAALLAGRQALVG